MPGNCPAPAHSGYPLPTMDERLKQILRIAREHYERREFDKAEPLLRGVLDELDKFADVYNMLGVMAHERRDFLEAERCFERALELNPGYTEAALSLTVTYNDLGKFDLARAVHERATGGPRPEGGMDPFVRGKIANMHADLGEVYAGFGMHDEGVREYARALDLCPDFVDLRVRLGNVYRDMGLFHAAIAEFEHAKRLKPEYLPARINLGVTLFSLDRKDDAIREWEAVLERDPENKNARLYLRMVRDAHGPKGGSALAPKPET